MERADSAPEHGKDAQSKHRVEFMKNVFELLDGDRDGFITSSDLRSFSVAETWDAGKRMDLAAFMDTVEESCQEVLEFCRSSPLKEAFECVESVSQHRGQDGHVPLAFLKKHLVLNDPQDPITEKQFDAFVGAAVSMGCVAISCGTQPLLNYKKLVDNMYI